MKNKIYSLVSLLVFLFAVGCGESLEDTYDEYIGNGMIRYVGKCTDVNVESGWERLRVTWKGNLDAGIKWIKVTWQSEYDEEPFVKLLKPRDIAKGEDLADTLSLDNLQDAIYTVRVSSISIDSVESIVEERYGRPYTLNHEDLRTFSRGIVNFYVLNDKLVVVLDEDNESLKKLILNFWDTEGNKHFWDIKEHMNIQCTVGRDYMFLLPEDEGISIDYSKPLTVEREGKLIGCLDEVPFADEILSLDERVWSPDFVQWLNLNYGPAWEEQIDKIETIELDYDITSLQNLFYFPNLKKVVFGKIVTLNQLTSKRTKSKTDIYSGLVTLQYLKEVRGVTSERYNQHYFGGSNMFDPMSMLALFDGKIDVGLVMENNNSNMNSIPVITPLDTTGWKVTCSDTMYNGYKEGGAAWLLDDDVFTYFCPGQSLSAKVFEVEIDMQKLQTVNGFKLRQYTTTSTSGKDIDEALAYLLPSLKIEVSVDGYIWDVATYENGGTTIGAALGEINFISIPEELRKPIRYIRLTMASRHVGEIDKMPAYSLRLSDFIPY